MQRATKAEEYSLDANDPKFQNARSTTHATRTETDLERSMEAAAAHDDRA
jgi:hypothetical protein